MTREDKAVLYDQLVREGDVVNRRISQIKSDVNLTEAAQTELDGLNKKLQGLEARVAQLFTEG
jgi:polyhydroxyalkanoate synthesis regulator phasin